MCHITTWEEDYKGNNTFPSLQSPLANSSSPSCIQASRQIAMAPRIVIMARRMFCVLRVDTRGWDNCLCSQTDFRSTQSHMQSILGPLLPGVRVDGA
jgi:hypothetical protein